jgi:ribose 5-phosphate isomerase RpiB
MAFKPDWVMCSLILALVTAGGSFAGLSIKSDNAEAAMKEALSTRFNDSSFHLEGAHAVTANYEGRNYTYNFDNKTVLGGQTRGVGFGGAGYGGMVSFDNFEDKAAIATARVEGCKIARQMETAENPGFPVRSEFEEARVKAARFKATYCP